MLEENNGGGASGMSYAQILLRNSTSPQQQQQHSHPSTNAPPQYSNAIARDNPKFHSFPRHGRNHVRNVPKNRLQQQQQRSSSTALSRENAVVKKNSPPPQENTFREKALPLTTSSSSSDNIARPSAADPSSSMPYNSSVSGKPSFSDILRRNNNQQVKKSAVRQQPPVSHNDDESSEDNPNENSPPRHSPQLPSHVQEISSTPQKNKEDNILQLQEKEEILLSSPSVQTITNITTLTTLSHKEEQEDEETPQGPHEICANDPKPGGGHSSYAGILTKGMSEDSSHLTPPHSVAATEPKKEEGDSMPGIIPVLEVEADLYHHDVHQPIPGLLFRADVSRRSSKKRKKHRTRPEIISQENKEIVIQEFKIPDVPPVFKENYGTSNSDARSSTILQDSESNGTPPSKEEEDDNISNRRPESHQHKKESLSPSLQVIAKAKKSKPLLLKDGSRRNSRKSKAAKSKDDDLEELEEILRSMTPQKASPPPKSLKEEIPSTRASKTKRGRSKNNDDKHVISSDEVNKEETYAQIMRRLEYIEGMEEGKSTTSMLDSSLSASPIESKTVMEEITQSLGKIAMDKGNEFQSTVNSNQTFSGKDEKIQGPNKNDATVTHLTKEVLDKDASHKEIISINSKAKVKKSRDLIRDVKNEESNDKKKVEQPKVEKKVESSITTSSSAKVKKSYDLLDDTCDDWMTAGIGDISDSEEDKKAEKKNEQPKVEKKIEHPKIEKKIEHPKVEKKVEQPKTEKKIESLITTSSSAKAKKSYDLLDDTCDDWMTAGIGDISDSEEDKKSKKPKAEKKNKQPKVEKKIEHPKIEKKIDHPKVEKKVEQPKTEKKIGSLITTSSSAKAKKSYDLLDDTCDNWMTAGIGDISDSEEDKKAEEPKAEKKNEQPKVEKIKQPKIEKKIESSIATSSSAKAKKSYDLLDDTCDDWMTAGIGDISDSEKDKKAEEPKAEKKNEQPKVEKKIEQLKVQNKIEQPKVEEKIENPKMEKKVESSTTSSSPKAKKSYDLLDNTCDDWMTAGIGDISDSEEDKKAEEPKAEKEVISSTTTSSIAHQTKVTETTANTMDYSAQTQEITYSSIASNFVPPKEVDSPEPDININNYSYPALIVAIEDKMPSLPKEVDAEGFETVLSKREKRKKLNSLRMSTSECESTIREIQEIINSDIDRENHDDRLSHTQNENDTASTLQVKTSVEGSEENTTSHHVIVSSETKIFNESAVKEEYQNELTNMSQSVESASSKSMDEVKEKVVIEVSEELSSTAEDLRENTKERSRGVSMEKPVLERRSSDLYIPICHSPRYGGRSGTPIEKSPSPSMLELDKESSDVIRNLVSNVTSMTRPSSRSSFSESRFEGERKYTYRKRDSMDSGRSSSIMSSMSNFHGKYVRIRDTPPFSNDNSKSGSLADLSSIKDRDESLAETRRSSTGYPSKENSPKPSSGSFSSLSLASRIANICNSTPPKVNEEEHQEEEPPIDEGEEHFVSTPKQYRRISETYQSLSVSKESRSTTTTTSCEINISSSYGDIQQQTPQITSDKDSSTEICKEDISGKKKKSKKRTKHTDQRSGEGTIIQEKSPGQQLSSLSSLDESHGKTIDVIKVMKKKKRSRGANTKKDATTEDSDDPTTSSLEDDKDSPKEKNEEGNRTSADDEEFEELRVDSKDKLLWSTLAALPPRPISPIPRKLASNSEKVPPRSSIPQIVLRGEETTTSDAMTKRIFDKDGYEIHVSRRTRTNSRNSQTELDETSVPLALKKLPAAKTILDVAKNDNHFARLGEKLDDEYYCEESVEKRKSQPGVVVAPNMMSNLRVRESDELVKNLSLDNSLPLLLESALNDAELLMSRDKGVVAGEDFLQSSSLTLSCKSENTLSHDEIAGLALRKEKKEKRRDDHDDESTNLGRCPLGKEENEKMTYFQELVFELSEEVTDLGVLLKGLNEKEVEGSVSSILYALKTIPELEGKAKKLEQDIQGSNLDSSDSNALRQEMRSLKEDIRSYERKVKSLDSSLKVYMEESQRRKDQIQKYHSLLLDLEGWCDGVELTPKTLEASQSQDYYSKCLNSAKVLEYDLISRSQELSSLLHEAQSLSEFGDVKKMSETLICRLQDLKKTVDNTASMLPERINILKVQRRSVRTVFVRSVPAA